MKSLKKISPLYVLVFMLMLPSLSLAATGGWTGKGIISSVSMNVGRVFVYGDSGEFESGNPDFCDKPFPIVIEPTLTDYSEIYALLVASYLQGHPVDLFVYGCYEMWGFTYPRVTAMRSYK